MARLGRSYAAVAIVNRFRGSTQLPTYGVAPAVSAVTDSTVNFVATGISALGSALTHYVGLYAAGSTPNNVQVRDGTGTGFIQGGSKAAASGAVATFDQLTGIARNGTAYRAAFTEADEYGILSIVAYVDFYTIIGQASRGELTVTGYAGALSNPKTVTVPYPLTLRTGAVRASLSSIHWSWFDQDDMGTLVTPTDQGTAETTDVSGNLAIPLTNSVLTSGQYGRLAIETSDKLSTAIYRIAIP